jgi:hypothetical protein
LKKDISQSQTALSRRFHTTTKKAPQPSLERALSIIGGRVELQQTVLLGHLAGAVEVVDAHLALIECAVHNSRAEFGGAIFVGHGAEVDVALSIFADNSAVSSRGALQALKVDSNP